MANSMKTRAEDSYNGKLDRMGLRIQTATTGPKGAGQQRSVDDGTDGTASGGRAEGYETEAANERTMEAKAPSKLRLNSRQNFASGGAVKNKRGTTVNVIVQPQGGPPQPPPIPPAALAAAMAPKPPMGPPPGAAGPEGGPPGAGGPPGMPPVMRANGGPVKDPVIRPDIVDDVKSGKIKFPLPDGRPGSIGRKSGGRVPQMTAGAGSGEGRLEKIEEYGANARKGAK